MPDLSIESGFDGPVIGVDEAGRGPWAGPVTIATAWLVPLPQETKETSPAPAPVDKPETQSDR